jgi:hypothetical protein
MNEERRRNIGKRNNAATPSKGPKIVGVNSSSKSGVSFLSNTSPTVTPIHVKTMPPGIMPMMVVQIKLKRRAPTSAGKIFARAKGTIGTNLNISITET